MGEVERALVCKREVTTTVRELRKALVLGSSGFIGRWLVDVLSTEGVELTLIDRNPAARVPAGASVRTTAVTAESVLDALRSQRPDTVFHLAGAGSVPPSLRDPIGDLNRNVGTTIEVLEALRSFDCGPVLVFASSAAVYGEAQRDPIDEGHPLEPKSPYGVSKLAAEHYVSLYVRSYGIPALAARPFSVYGPGQDKLVVYDLLARLCEGERPLTIRGASKVSRDFVFVEDVARALLGLARAAPARGEAYNIASGVGVTLGDLAELLIEVSGVDTEATFTGRVRSGDPLSWRGDPTRARSLGVACETPLAEGLKHTAAWIAATANAPGRSSLPEL